MILMYFMFPYFFFNWFTNKTMYGQYSLVVDLPIQEIFIYMHIHTYIYIYILDHLVPHKYFTRVVFWCHYRCVITGNGKHSYAYLGRPWGPFGRVVFAYTYMDQCIRPVGWDNWGKMENERSACFYEYR